jgi:hypothetical protein
MCTGYLAWPSTRPVSVGKGWAVHVGGGGRADDGRLLRVMAEVGSAVRGDGRSDRRDLRLGRPSGLQSALRAVRAAVRYAFRAHRLRSGATGFPSRSACVAAGSGREAGGVRSWSEGGGRAG